MSSSDLAISVRGLSKSYTINHQHEQQSEGQPLTNGWPYSDGYRSKRPNAIPEKRVGRCSPKMPADCWQTTGPKWEQNVPTDSRGYPHLEFWTENSES